MAISEAKKKANAKWDSENMATLACKVKRTQANAFKSYCAERGQTSNTALKNYVFECIGEQDNPQNGAGDPTAAPAVRGGILSPDMLKAAQEAAKATGEDTPQFVARAVRTQAQRDKSSLSMGINPATGERAIKKEAGE